MNIAELMAGYATYTTADELSAGRGDVQFAVERNTTPGYVESSVPDEENLV